MRLMVTIMLLLIDVGCGCFMLAYCCLLLEVVGWYDALDDDCLYMLLVAYMESMVIS